MSHPHYMAADANEREPALRVIANQFAAIAALACLALPCLAEQAPASDAQASEPATVEPATVKGIDGENAADSSDTSEELAPRLPLDELRAFTDAFNRISSAYVEEVDDRALLEKAIRGMLSELDPHSAYLDQESLDELEEETTGNYGGLGLEVAMDDGLLRVIAPMDDTPAAKAGLEPGDIIIELDDTPVRGMDLSEAITTMRGEPGTTIVLTIVKSGSGPPTDVTVTREIIKIASVRHRWLEPGYAYIRIAQFQSGTGSEVEDALREMFEETHPSGIVLDLRNNPGGVLQAAVDVSDLFIDEGLIVYTSGRLNNADLRFAAARPDVTEGTPVVVLVNEGTASASEIVAGALQDHKRAVIMGTHTFGKGSVQTILPLDNDKAIKLTTARYYTPNGNSIQAEGIRPDIWVDRSTVTPVKSNPWRLRERDLPGHLSADQDEADGDGADDGREEEIEGVPEEELADNLTNNLTKSAEDGEEEETESLASRDYQLNEALTLLKGLNILAKPGHSSH